MRSVSALRHLRLQHTGQRTFGAGSAGKQGRPPPPGRLKQPKLGHRRRVAASHDDVVEHLHIDELQRALQLAREDLVGPAGLPAKRRVVVGQNDGRAVAGEGPAYNLSWIKSKGGIS